MTRYLCFRIDVTPALWLGNTANAEIMVYHYSFVSHQKAKVQQRKKLTSSCAFRTAMSNEIKMKDYFHSFSYLLPNENQHVTFKFQERYKAQLSITITLFRESQYFHTCCFFIYSGWEHSNQMRLLVEKLREHGGSSKRNMDPLSCTVEA